MVIIYNQLIAELTWLLMVFLLSQIAHLDMHHLVFGINFQIHSFSLTILVSSSSSSSSTIIVRPLSRITTMGVCTPLRARNGAASGMRWCRLQEESSTQVLSWQKTNVYTEYYVRFTSSTCQPISLIIPALVIHHPFNLSLQAQNLPFQQILPTLDLFYQLDCLMITGLDRTYHAHQFIISFAFSFFLFIPCGRLSRLSVSFLLHVIHTIVSYRIVSYLWRWHHDIISYWQVL